MYDSFNPTLPPKTIRPFAEISSKSATFNNSKMYLKYQKFIKFLFRATLSFGFGTKIGIKIKENTSF